MSKTKNINIFKVLQYPLTVKAAKVVVPVYVYNLTTAERAFIIINALQRTKIATKESLKGYRAFLKHNKDNEKILFHWLHTTLRDRGIAYELLVDKSWEYINLQELYDFNGTEIDIVSNFSKYLHAHVYDNGTFTKYVEYYLKYLPYMSNIISTPQICEGNGYCCMDCDGDFHNYVSNQYKHEADMLQFKLRDKINVNYVYNPKFGW